VVRSSSPATESVRNLLTAGRVMAAGVLVCVLRAPKPIQAGDGLSWFGVTGATVVEYGLAAGRGDRVNGSTRSAGSSCPA
jgi:hypothetical protein